MARAMTTLWDPDEPSTTTRHHLRKELDELIETITPYGRLIQEMQFDALGQPAKFLYAQPAALIWMACALNPKFGDFTSSCVNDGRPLRLTIYAGEFTAGNVLGFEPRSVMAVYYTFADFPAYFRKRTNS
eukprot:5797133-Pyramimonas_sp.AAC.1